MQSFTAEDMRAPNTKPISSDILDTVSAKAIVNSMMMARRGKRLPCWPELPEPRTENDSDKRIKGYIS